MKKLTFAGVLLAGYVLAFFSACGLGSNPEISRSPCDTGQGGSENSLLKPDASLGECQRDGDCPPSYTVCKMSVCRNHVCLQEGRDDDDDSFPFCDENGTAGAGDCDDQDRMVHPGKPDKCGDGIDNDCNGQIDEGCFTFCDLDASEVSADAFGAYVGCCEAQGVFPTADAPQSGWLIKSPSTNRVYYYASNHVRYLVADAYALASWFGRLDSHGAPILDDSVCGKVTSLPDAVFDQIPSPFGAYVAVRPGTMVVGKVGSPERYVVQKGRQLLKLADPSFVSELFPGVYRNVALYQSMITPFSFTQSGVLNNPADYHPADERKSMLEQDLGIIP